MKKICMNYFLVRAFVTIVLLCVYVTSQALEVEASKISSNTDLEQKVSIILLQISDDDKTKPTYDVDLERNVSDVIIGDELLSGDYVVTLKAGDKKGVRVKVRNKATGLTAYRKNFSKSYLYGLSDNTLLVGKGDILTQVIVWKEDGKWIVMIKEKGIY